MGEALVPVPERGAATATPDSLPLKEFQSDEVK